MKSGDRFRMTPQNILCADLDAILTKSPSPRNTDCFDCLSGNCSKLVDSIVLMVKQYTQMKRGLMFYVVMLITVAVLSFAIENPQNIFASKEGHNRDYSNDSPFSLPFNSHMVYQSNDGGEIYQLDANPPFP